MKLLSETFTLGYTYRQVISIISVRYINTVYDTEVGQRVCVSNVTTRVEIQKKYDKCGVTL